MTVESRSVVVRLSAETAQYIREMQNAGKVGVDAMQKVEKGSISASQAQDRLAGGAGKVGIAGAVALGAIVTATSGFDQAMSKVQAATHETETGMRSLRDAALEAGADTAFSANEAAAGIENLAKAGVSTQDILDGGLTGALDLAAAGELAVADAAEAAAGALAQFKLDGDQAVHVADLLAAGAGKAQGDVSDMVLALKQAGTVSAQTGLSLEETVGALSAMAEQSLLGSDAGTSFKTMLAALTPNSVKAAQAMEQYNIHAFDAQGNFVGMTELAGQLRDGLSGLTDEQRAMALETIFGSDAVRAASIIYDNGADGIADWTAKVNDAGFAAETAAIKQDNLRGDLEKLGGAFQTALIGSGEGSTGVLRSVTQGLTRVVDAYSELPPSAQSATSAVLAGATAIGGSIWVGSKLVRGIADTREALDTLEASGSKAGKVMRGLAAAGAGLTVLIAAAEAVKAIQRATDESLPGVEGLTGRLLDLQLASSGFSVSLGGEFDSLGASIDRLTDPGRATAISDTLQTPFEGLFGEAAGLRQARAEIELLDASLASIVTSAGPEAAADALQRLVDSGYLTEAQLKDLRGELGQYDEAVASAANESKLAAAAEGELADASQGVGAAMAGATPLTKAQADAIKEAREQASGTAREFFNLGESLNDSKVSLSDWITEMAQQADALENFTINAKKAGKNGLREGLIQDLQNAGTEGALRLKQLANASEEEIARANKAWKRGQDAIDAYVDATVKVPENVSTSVDVDTSSAQAAIRALRGDLVSIQDETVLINIVRRETNRANTEYTGEGRRRAGGGQVFGPGTTTSDSIPAWLSNKEYVIKAAAVDHYGVGFFDSANAMRLAGGGPADKKKRRKGTGEALEWNGGPSDQALAYAAAQAAEAAERYYAEQERTQREAEERAAEQSRIAEAVLDGQQRAWDSATDAAKAQVDASKTMVDTVKANMDRLGNAAVAGFDSPLFSKNSQQHGLWTGGSSASGWRGALTGDITGLRERSSLITQLSAPGMGLSPDALEALLGQADNTQIRDLLAAGEVNEYATLFAERARLRGEVSTQAGMAGYGREWQAANAQWTAMNQKLELLTTIIAAARPITVTETISARALVDELARLQAASGGF